MSDASFHPDKGFLFIDPVICKEIVNQFIESYFVKYDP
jgi:hypothetical protein